MSDDAPLLEIRNLEKHFEESTNILNALLRRETSQIQAVDDVSLTLKENESTAVIGESGCGKTTLLLTLIGLHDITGGDIYYKGTPLTSFDSSDWKEYRRNVQVIFQDPFNSLNPKMTVEESVKEPLNIHGVGNRDERVREVLEDVELSPPGKYLRRKPVNLSGGEKQRVSIGRALVLNPDIILADEPVSMLDVSTQAAVLNMMDKLINEYGASMIYISHDLSTVSYISETVNVMYLGRIIESAPTEQILADPKHPYTKALVSAIPIPDPHYDRDRTEMSGAPRDPIDLGEGCRFRDRCPEVIPPEKVNIDQAAYREVMAFREQLEREELSLDRIRAILNDPNDGDAFATVIREEHFDHELEGENATVLDAALRSLADGNREAAVDRLQDRFESICEVTPNSTEVESDWDVACHHYYNHENNQRTREKHATSTD
jgi:peptide/nickel transport system ATP-binding protein